MKLDLSIEEIPFGTNIQDIVVPDVLDVSSFEVPEEIVDFSRHSAWSRLSLSFWIRQVTEVNSSNHLID